MTGSALVATPPANSRDLAIVKGLLAYAGLTGKWPPEKGTPPSPKWPKDRNTDSKQGDIIASSIVAIVVISLITGSRIFARTSFKHRSIGWDDYFIILATLILIVFISLIMAQACVAGWGKHDCNLTYADEEKNQQLNYPGNILLFLVQGTTKLSIVCFNARLTGLTSMIWNWIHRFLFVCATIYVTFWPLYTIFGSRPVGAQYSYRIAGNDPNFHWITGFRSRKKLLAATIIHITFDWILLCTPILIIVRLHMSIKKKLRCIVPLSVGALSCIGASYTLHLVNFHFVDLSFQYWGIMCWRYLDLVCGVIVTSVPAVASLLTHHLPEKWRMYYPSEPSIPKIYVGDYSNPFSWKISIGVHTVDRSNNRDKYDEIGGINIREDVGLENIRRDVDLESSGEGWDDHEFKKDNQTHLQYPERIHAPRTL